MARLDRIGANLSSCHDRAWPGYPRLAVRQAVKSWVAGPGPIGAKLTTNPPWHSPLHRHPRARPGDQSTLDVVKMIPGSSPGMTVQGTRTLILAPMGLGPVMTKWQWSADLDWLTPRRTGCAHVSGPGPVMMAAAQALNRRATTPWFRRRSPARRRPPHRPAPATRHTGHSPDRPG